MGVGPDQIERVYPRYRVPDAVKPTNPHLHNVPMQIAAERGLPALAAWIWFVVSAFARPVQAGAGRRGSKSLAAAGLGAHGGDAGRRPDRIQFRRLRIPDAAAGDDHACRSPPTATAACRREHRSMLPDICPGARPRADRPLRVAPHHRGRRRHARSLPDRPRQPHVARGAGAGGGVRSRRVPPRRRRQCRQQPARAWRRPSI